MSDNPVDINPGANGGVTPLLASATAAETRAPRGLAVAIADFFLPDEARLDERTRTALALLLREAEGNVALRVDVAPNSDAYVVSGRGEPALLGP